MSASSSSDVLLRVLVDTNVFISFLLTPASPGGMVSRLVEAAILGEFTLLLPEELLDELDQKLRTNPKLVRRIGPDESQEFVAILRAVAETLPAITEPIPAVVRDPKDDYLLAQALLNRADLLVSRDKDLLSLGTVEQVRIVSPFKFVQGFLGRG